MPSWNPDLYLRFNKERSLPAQDLIKQIESTNPITILDVGSGPGNSTKLLKDAFPTARVIGVDNNQAMIDKAKSTVSNCEFLFCDAMDIDKLDCRFDIIFSNACIQWIPNQKALLTKMFSLLKEDGILAIQTPDQANQLMQKLVNDLVNSCSWEKLFRQKRDFHNLSLTEYHDFFSSFTNDFRFFQTTYYHRLPDHNAIIEWYKGTGLRPYLDELNEALQNDFLADMLNLVKNHYPVMANEEVIFPFPRLFLLARKSHNKLLKMADIKTI